MLSPITAPRTAATIIAGNGIRPAAAATPPRITAISPGNTNPMNAEDSSAGRRKTARSTAQPGSASRRSGSDAVMVVQGIYPRRPVRGMPPKKPRVQGLRADAGSRPVSRASDGPVRRAWDAPSSNQADARASHEEVAEMTVDTELVETRAVRAASWIGPRAGACT